LRYIRNPHKQLFFPQQTKILFSRQNAFFYNQKFGCHGIDNMSQASLLLIYILETCSDMVYGPESFF